MNLFFHHFEKLVVVFGLTNLVHEEFHRLNFVHVVKDSAQQPDFLQQIGLDEQLFAACRRAVDVDGWVNPLLGHAALEVDFHVAGAFEFFVNHFVHAAACVYQGCGNDGE